MSEKRAIVRINKFIVTETREVSADDVNAFYFSNIGTNQVQIQGETVFPQETLVFGSNNDESLDFSTYDIVFPFPNLAGNRVLVRTRKVQFETWTK
jgi:hypothetical protein